MRMGNVINIFDISQKLSPVSISKLEDVGDILQYLLPWGALLAVALQGDKTAAWDWLIAGGLTTASTFLLKWLFNFTPLGRRPNGAPFSFPSGHTSSAFFGAAFFHFSIGWMWALLPYILAAFTGYTRIHAKKHWQRDVIAGAALAMGITFWVVAMR